MLALPEGNNLTRLMVWAGVLLCAFAFLGPAWTTRSTALLEFSTLDLAQMRPEAQREIERRQHVATDVAEAAPIWGGLLLLAGSLLLVVSVPRLHRYETAEQGRQADADDRFRKETMQLFDSLNRQTADEHSRSTVNEEQEQEAAEERADADASPQSDGVDDGGGEDSDDYEAKAHAAASVALGPAQDQGRSTETARLFGALRAQSIEERVLLNLQRVAAPTYSLKARTRVGRYEADGLLLSLKRGRPDLLVEIKAPAKVDRIAWRVWGQHLMNAVASSEAEFGRKTQGWLIIVLPPGSSHGSQDVDLLPKGLLVSVLQGEAAIESMSLPE